jgi:hypothetical protein
MPELLSRSQTCLWEVGHRHGRSPPRLRQQQLVGEDGFMISAASCFPDLSFVQNWPKVEKGRAVVPFISIRLGQPISKSETEVYSWFAVDRAAPPEYPSCPFPHRTCLDRGSAVPTATLHNQCLHDPLRRWGPSHCRVGRIAVPQPRRRQRAGAAVLRPHRRAAVLRRAMEIGAPHDHRRRIGLTDAEPGGVSLTDDNRPLITERQQ